MNKNVTAIDFSSSGIRVVTGYCFRNKVYVRQALEGLPLKVDEHGQIDIDDASNSLMILLNNLKKTINDDIGLIVPIFPADSLSISNNSGTSYTSGEVISQADYTNCLGIILKQTNEANKKVVFSLPYFFSTDNQNKNPTVFPLGLRATELTIYADTFSINTLSYKRYVKILENCGLKDYYFEMVSPLAAISFINRTSDVTSKKFDSYLAVDFENDLTYVSYVKNHRLVAIKTLNVGIAQVLKTVSDTLGIDLAQVNDLKNLFGLKKDYEIDNPLLDVDLTKFTEAFSSEMRKLIIQINDAISGFLIDGNLPLIIYGYGSDILEIGEILTEIIGLDTLMFQPQVIGARNRVFTDCLGAILLSNETYLENQETALRHRKDRIIQTDNFGRYSEE